MTTFTAGSRSLNVAVRRISVEVAANELDGAGQAIPEGPLWPPAEQRLGPSVVADELHDLAGLGSNPVCLGNDRFVTAHERKHQGREITDGDALPASRVD